MTIHYVHISFKFYPVKLFHNCIEQLSARKFYLLAAIALVKKKTLPHLLFLGKWSTFILRIPRGQILLYYEDDPVPLFEWSHSNPMNAFLPTYYYCSSERGRVIGIAFDRETGKFIIYCLDIQLHVQQISGSNNVIFKRRSSFGGRKNTSIFRNL